MRKLNSIIILLFLFMLVGCNHVEEKIEEESKQDNIFYFGKGNEWFGTYTISKVNHSYFESLYIQHIRDRTDSVKEQATNNIGNIEYVLNKGNSQLESNYPQPIQGIGSFHTAIEVSEDLINNMFPDQLTLTIKWNGKSEIIELKK
ncbi:hypothetical protein J2Z40_003560 [Cytobacillus eiseniae]|uniref:Lipoprotein n=1 Tax=Cytobacillus eiseniae TaxID=762947 RepID=A0ABS4RJM1_9BACI|nr:hypothetical protein [Cytobacillus eiseniae]MBP2242978.1 hypothetical protein [Cytobacillus eiseniae]